ncbi:hypothetical protein [Streptomyces sp. NBC_01212]|uniref:hypothetical protein n=1 Tax=Streptomyces sp. NBC_01212 TaxID=2903775 RepID=UPI002E10D187|nr:hypothetical protein OG722_04890 [Streptomyces sp. NBC_01212]
MKVYKIKGTTDEFTTCDLCGRDELKGTVVLASLDADGNEYGEVSYFGTSCAAKAAGWTVREVTAGVKAVADEQREAERQERAAEAARYQKFKNEWYLTNYGTTDPHEAAKLAGTSAARLSSEPLRAYKESQKPADAPAPVVAETPVRCTSLAEPGNMHFMVIHCVDCNAFLMAKMTVEEVGGWYRSGYFNQDEYEAFMHVWATSAVRHSAGSWVEVPIIPKVIALVAAIRRHAGITVPAVLAA